MALPSEVVPKTDLVLEPVGWLRNTYVSTKTSSLPAEVAEVSVSMFPILHSDSLHEPSTVEVKIRNAHNFTPQSEKEIRISSMSLRIPLNTEYLGEDAKLALAHRAGNLALLFSGQAKEELTSFFEPKVGE